MYGPTWPFLLTYGSYDERHTGFPQVDGGQRDPRDRGVTVVLLIVMISKKFPTFIHSISSCPL